MSFFLGGGETGKEVHLGGRGRGVKPSDNQFSLGWAADGGDEAAPSVGGAPRGGKRIGGPAFMPSKDAYAMQLQDQIAARDAQRAAAADQWTVPSHAPAQPGGGVGARQRQASFARLGSTVVDGQCANKNAAYAADLKAQIDSKAANKADERHQRMQQAEERAQRTEAAHQQQNLELEKENQAQRHRGIDANADALERFLGNQKGPGPISAPAGMSHPQEREAQQFQRRGGGLPRQRGDTPFAIG